MKNIFIFIAVLCLILVPATLRAQLTFVSSVPEDGTAGVEIGSTITLTFSEALGIDESTEEVMIDFDIFPEPSGWAGIPSADGKTYYLSFSLEANTIYKISIWEARSESGTELEDPVFITFSTGETLPTASISGTISNPDVLSDLPLFVSLLDESGQSSGLTPVNDDAAFSIGYVEDGSYYVVATNFDDEESNSGDEKYISYYGWDGTGDDTPDEVEVSGGAVTGISLTMRNATTMKLLSFSPADDAVNVERNSNLSYTFNLPLDAGFNPSYLFELLNFYNESLQLVIAPESDGDQFPVPAFSDFGRTVTMTFSEPFLDNTYYTGVVKWARDIMGKELDDEQAVFENPSQFGFTTGDAIPSNSISGTVTITNEPESEVIVGLFDADPIDNDFADLLGVGLPSSADGSYSIGVPDGTYFPAAIASFSIGDEIEELRSGYGRGTAGADPVTVSGADMSDIDMTLAVPIIISVSGMVRDTDGNPVAGVRVQVSSTNNWEYVQTDSNGRFTFSNLISEYMQLAVLVSIEAEFRSKTIKFTPGSQPVTINITLQSSDPHYSYTDDTGGSYPVAVYHPTVSGLDLSTDDEVAVIAKSPASFSGMGPGRGSEMQSLMRTGEIVVGSAIYNYELPFTITAWKDDPATEEKDGYAKGDSIIFEIWDASLGREYRAVPVFIFGDGKFGTGDSTAVYTLKTTQYQIAERVRNVLTTDTDKLRIAFEDDRAVSVQFTGGAVAGAEVSMASFENILPDSIKQRHQVQDTLMRVAGYYEISSTISDTFTAELSFEYTEAMLMEAGLNEDYLVMTRYDSAAGMWEAVPTFVDVINRVASVWTNHFSLWALKDSADAVITDVREEAITAVPDEFKLYHNYPNPFNPTTTIKYELKSPSFVTLAIFNILGQRVRTLVNTAQPSGTHQVLWDARSDTGMPVSSGIYFFRIQAGAFVQTNKMLLLR